MDHTMGPWDGRCTLLLSSPRRHCHTCHCPGDWLVVTRAFQMMACVASGGQYRRIIQPMYLSSAASSAASAFCAWAALGGGSMGALGSSVAASASLSRADTVGAFRCGLTLALALALGALGGCAGYGVRAWFCVAVEAELAAG